MIPSLRIPRIYTPLPDDLKTLRDIGKQWKKNQNNYIKISLIFPIYCIQDKIGLCDVIQRYDFEMGQVYSGLPEQLRAVAWRLRQ